MHDLVAKASAIHVSPFMTSFTLNVHANKTFQVVRATLSRLARIADKTLKNFLNHDFENGEIFPTDVNQVSTGT